MLDQAKSLTLSCPQPMDRLTGGLICGQLVASVMGGLSGGGLAGMLPTLGTVK